MPIVLDGNTEFGISNTAVGKGWDAANKPIKFPGSEFNRTKVELRQVSSSRVSGISILFYNLCKHYAVYG